MSQPTDLNIDHVASLARLALTPEEKGRFARLDLDPASITWRRVMDINDRCRGKVWMIGVSDMCGTRDPAAGRGRVNAPL